MEFFFWIGASVNIQLAFRHLLTRGAPKQSFSALALPWLHARAGLGIRERSFVYRTSNAGGINEYYKINLQPALSPRLGGTGTHEGDD